MQKEKYEFLKNLKERHDNCLKLVTDGAQKQKEVIDKHSNAMKAQLLQTSKESQIDPDMINELYSKYAF